MSADKQEAQSSTIAAKDPKRPEEVYPWYGTNEKGEPVTLSELREAFDKERKVLEEKERAAGRPPLPGVRYGFSVSPDMDYVPTEEQKAILRAKYDQQWKRFAGGVTAFRAKDPGPVADDRPRPGELEEAVVAIPACLHDSKTRLVIHWVDGGSLPVTRDTWVDAMKQCRGPFVLRTEDGKNVDEVVTFAAQPPPPSTHPVTPVQPTVSSEKAKDQEKEAFKAAFSVIEMGFRMMREQERRDRSGMISSGIRYASPPRVTLPPPPVAPPPSIQKDTQ